MDRLLCILLQFLLLQSFLLISEANANSTSNRKGKLFSFFQIIRFPNDPCMSGTQNGTCYTAEECSKKGGSNGGACAQGYGVCCIFSVSCGATSSQNCTYFTSANQPNIGTCQLTICPCGSNICQLRLDFMTFAINGPTQAITTLNALYGVPVQTGGTNVVNTASQCLPDTFSVTSPDGIGPPTICGTNTGEHMYVESSKDCNDLVFELGDATGSSTSRQWNIKITQYACDYSNLAPVGCTQYFFGGDTGQVETFNFQAGSGRHLADQSQNICVRRERPNCRICWTVAQNVDFAISKTGVAMSTAKSCCGYSGTAANGKGVFDCAVFPGAMKKANSAPMGSQICGSGIGLKTLAATGKVSICSRLLPFSVHFLSDNFENPAIETGAQTGFMLSYEMDCPP